MKAGLSDRLRRRLERLGPYQSLALLLVPASIVEPLKLVAVAVAGEGHWFTGTAMIVAAYAASLSMIERLFVIVKPRLLKLRWFARLWAWVVIFKYRIAQSIRAVSRRRRACPRKMIWKERRTRAESTAARPAGPILSRVHRPRSGMRTW